MFFILPDIAQILNAAPAVSAVLLAWQLWALLSELLLAATHLKVLLCIGKPIPANQLSSKRWTYFLYDLISPWFSLASIVTSYTLPLVAAVTAHSTTGMAGSTTSSNGIVNVNSMWNACSPMPGSDLPQPRLHQAYQCNALKVIDPLLNSTLATHELQLALDHPIHCMSLNLAAAAAAAIGPSFTAAVTPIQQLLVLFVGAHAALHLYYIASWHSAHSKNVVQMSASSSMGSRTKQFASAEVVWFFIGTSYDILTHLVMCGLLLQSLASSYNALRT